MNRRAPTVQTAFAATLWTLFAGWMGLIFYLSSLPSERVPGGWFPNFDKLLHVGAFGLGTLLLLGALHLSVRWPARRIAALAVLGITAFGLFDEWHQLSSPNRSGADPYDLAADTLGALLATAAFRAATHYVRSRRRDHPGTHRAALAGD